MSSNACIQHIGAAADVFASPQKDYCRPGHTRSQSFSEAVKKSRVGLFLKEMVPSFQALSVLSVGMVSERTQDKIVRVSMEES
mmetsp:Transcript_14778/g.23305  ORF Transcript_14778/g.23305 Transcript_14778/m.23305 type:complete len:83 (-) Transcript_14778:410-658(-)